MGWHDPNFGIRLDEYIDAIEGDIPPDSIDFLAESSLSVLTEPHLKLMQKNGFKGILLGIESWYEMGNKSKTGRSKGLENDPAIRSYWEGDRKEIPSFYTDWIKMDLGPLRQWLPENALYHDEKAYFKAQEPEVIFD